MICSSVAPSRNFTLKRKSRESNILVTNSFFVMYVRGECTLRMASSHFIVYHMNVLLSKNLAFLDSKYFLDTYCFLHKCMFVLVR
jgi:hypothetical protein